MRLDVHHFLWAYDPDEYGWIGEEMSVIQRDFLPADLVPEIQAAGIHGVIPVQAPQSTEETEWLLDLTGQRRFINGVVGWVSLISRQDSGELERYAANAKCCGVRHVLRGEPEAFGPAHTMFGSDWPVCPAASGYAHWVQTVERLTAGLSGAEHAQIFGGTAARAYQLS